MLKWRKLLDRMPSQGNTFIQHRHPVHREVRHFDDVMCATLNRQIAQCRTKTVLCCGGIA